MMTKKQQDAIQKQIREILKNPDVSKAAKQKLVRDIRKIMEHAIIDAWAFAKPKLSAQEIKKQAEIYAKKSGRKAWNDLMKKFGRKNASLIAP